ncbi:lysylphosphatidylglycerol synthase domain-containing protein [Isosphaeraceae bacterium EP7]
MPAPRWKRPAKLALKSAVAVLVLWYLGRHVARTWRDLNAQGESIQIAPAWIALAGGLYLAGLAACGMVYARVLAAGSTPVGTAAAIRAYLISHLGKYVPGKAMVVVMRVGLTTPYGARPATAALATFYETLAMMAAGALAGALGFALGPRPIQWIPLGASAGLAALLLAVVEPKVFPRVAALMTMPFPNVGPDALPSLSYRLLGTGLLWSLAGWVLLGLSQLAVVRGVSSAGIDLALWPVVIASVALATVAGFVVAVMPGGLGVREGVLMATLAPAVGHDRAVVSALALRLTWVAAEVIAGGLLALARPSGRLAPAGVTEP